MLTQTLRPRIHQSLASRSRFLRAFSTTDLSNGITLAYDLYQAPAKSKNGLRDLRENAPPIIFLHGLFGSKKNNRSMSKVLARDLNRPVYALDLRNHGDSSHHPRHDYLALAEDVELFINHHSLRDISLIGHSMGAKTAMAVALRDRSPIADLIPVDNAPIDAALKSDFHKYIEGMRKIEDEKCQKQSEADAVLQGYEESLPVRQFLLTNLVRPNNGDGSLKFRVPLKTLAGALDNMADFPFKDPDDARFGGPTLIVRGTKSHYVADEFLPVIGRFFPKFELADIDSGHWVVSEKPEEFRRAVVDFLQEKD